MIFDNFANGSSRFRAAVNVLITLAFVKAAVEMCENRLMVKIVSSYPRKVRNTQSDFTCSIVAPWLSFNALVPPVRAGVLLTGSMIGIMSGLLLMVLGSFGVQEGSLAGIFTLPGAWFEQAVPSASLLRISHYLLPYCLILLFYHRLLRRATHRAIVES